MANDDAPDSKPAPARPAKRRTVTQVARPYFFTADGERVELSLDVLGGAAVEVADEALESLDAQDGDAPRAPRPAATPGATRAIYSGNGCEVVVDLSRDLQLTKRAVRGAAAPAEAPVVPPTAAELPAAELPAPAPPAPVAAPAPPAAPAPT
ncbi:MAG TPA: hypothetical protein VGB66_05445, partial [Longimicrobium sp.]